VKVLHGWFCEATNDFKEFNFLRFNKLKVVEICYALLVTNGVSGALDKPILNLTITTTSECPVA
jgi:hypothetical protein